MNNTKLLVESWRSYLNESELLEEGVGDTLKTLLAAGVVGAILVGAAQYGEKKRMESLKDHPEVEQMMKPDENAYITTTKDGKKMITVMGSDGKLRTGVIK